MEIRNLIASCRLLEEAFVSSLGNCLSNDFGGAVLDDGNEDEFLHAIGSLMMELGEAQCQILAKKEEVKETELEAIEKAS